MNKSIFIKGINYGWNSSRGDYISDLGIESMDKIVGTNCNWISISFELIQDTFLSTNIYFDYQKSLTDSEIIFAIEHAHELQLKVCLKPVVNPQDGVWRGFISFSEAGDYWAKWFKSYTNAMIHYAEIAEKYHCEMFCIGCEMVRTQRREYEWCQYIKLLRNSYQGLLTYNANHDAFKDILWLDKIDIIGLSAYVEMQNCANVDEMVHCWTGFKEEVKTLYKRFEKPIVFMEIGCINGTGCSVKPWQYELSQIVEYNENEQADYYEAAFRAMWNEEWFSGFFWWEWPIKLYKKDDVKKDISYSPYLKKAERVLRKWYKNEGGRG